MCATAMSLRPACTLAADAALLPSRSQLKKYFTFEVQVLDDKNVRRRFRASNYQVRPHTHCTVILRGLGAGYRGSHHALCRF